MNRDIDIKGNTFINCIIYTLVVFDYRTTLVIDAVKPLLLLSNTINSKQSHYQFGMYVFFVN